MIATQSNFTVFILYLSEMYRLDTSDDLVLDKHEFKKDCWCITHTVTGRAVQVSMGEYLTLIDYIDGKGGDLEKGTQVYAAIRMAGLTYDFLMGHTKSIQYEN